jgi:hypothetical protein
LSKTALVVTSINSPTAAVKALAEGAECRGIDFIIIGDRKSPPDFSQIGARYFDLEAQAATGLGFARDVPVGHYARKNIGYLLAAASGAEIIIETDDDNLPLDSFWTERRRELEARAPEVANARWVNVYSYFTSRPIWPRGLPLDVVRAQPPALKETRLFDCPIQQGLANANPDVDAIYRLLMPLPVEFEDASSVALGSGAWCPFNSQNTTWWRSAFPLLYLPFHCSFRMTDIWRSFVAQRIAWSNGWPILFHAPTVWQDRNEHDLMRDFADELPGYLNNRQMASMLDQLDLTPGERFISANMRICYQALVQRGWVGGAELGLLDAWLADLADLGF